MGYSYPKNPVQGTASATGGFVAYSGTPNSVASQTLLAIGASAEGVLTVNANGDLSVMSQSGIGRLKLNVGGTVEAVDPLLIDSSIQRLNGVATVGAVGVEPIYASVLQTSLAATTAAASSFVPSTAASAIFEVGFVCQVVTSGSVSMQVQAAYTNERGASITNQVLGCTNGNGSAVATGTITTTGNFNGRALIWVDNSGGTISLKTTGTTATLYDLYTYIKQVA